MKHLSILLMLSIFANAQVDYESEIQTIWNQNCVNCHNQSSSNWNQHLLDLSDGVSHGNLMAVSSNYSPANRVVPNDPNQSVLYNKLANTGTYGDVMPPAGQLSTSLIDLVETWIDEGATEGGGSNGRIEGTITLDEEWVFSQVRMKLTLLGGGFLEQNWGEDPPFNNLAYFFEDPQITEGGPYVIEAYFDANNNNVYEGDEPYVMVDNLYVPASLVLTDINLTLASGVSGGFSFDFGATSNGANVSNFNFPAGNQILVEMFIKLHTGDTFFDLFGVHSGGQDDWLLFTYENGGYYFEIEGVGSVTWNTSPVSNEWHHLAAEYDGVYLRIYFDGIVMATVPVSASFPATNNSLDVGWEMDGLGDVVRISSVARHVGNNFDPWATTPPPDQDTHLLWHCNEGSGSILNDESGNGYNGSGFGTGTWIDDEPWDGGGNFIFEPLSPICGSADNNPCNSANATMIEPMVDGDPESSAGLGGNPDFYYEFSLDNGEQSINVIKIENGFPTSSGSDDPCYWMGEGTIEVWNNGSQDWMWVANIDNSTPNKIMEYNFAEVSTNQIRLNITQVGGNQNNSCHAEITEIETGKYTDSGTGLWFTNYSSDYVDLEWNRWPDADGEFYKYEIRRETFPGVAIPSSPIILSETNVNVLSWRDNDVAPGNNYYYKLWMYESDGVHRYESSELLFVPPGSGDTGKINCDIHVNRAINGDVHIGLYNPGNNPDSGPPDYGPAPASVNLAADDHWNYEFTNLPDGNGYTVAVFIDAVDSPNSGPDDCDDGWDLKGLVENINVNGGSQENANVEMDECGGGADYPVISNFAITSGNAYTDGDAPVDISVELDAGTGISEAKIQYYKGGDDGNMLESNLAETGSTWTGSISAGDVTMEGLMVQVFAKSNNGDESISGMVEVPIFFNSYTFSSLAAKQYTMVSFPGDLATNGVENIMESNLGNSDPTQWRIFSYNNSSESYNENSGSFTAGNAFWVISRNSAVLTGGNGEVTPLENTFTFTLDQGWNMIGDPYAFDLDFSTQVTTTGDVEMTLYSYDGSGYVTKTNMLPGEGYWIWSYEDGATLDFDHTTSGGSQKQMTGGWAINLSAAINGFHDSENKLGVHPQAKDERDGMDSREPPVIGDYVQLAFDNADWADKGFYAKDIRNDGQNSYTWHVSVRSNMSGQINLNAVDANSIPFEYDAVLVDMENKIPHNLRSGESYTYVSIGDERAHKFQVIIGLQENVSKRIDELGILPTEFSVNQNVPNPFNPVTAIRLQLVEDAFVTMKVFNILGEEVMTLVNNKYIESGYHQIIWNGRDNTNRQVPTGLYLYQTVMKNDQGKLLHINTKKMVLVK